ncbi:aldehyde dehydrogenase family protein [Tabrizicola oligotrophica]|uniref:Aldehyde dehydrogenase family protein n=1 Tax=Tabrizicola oligotrophica TaxID=2710650 RepID=A0A6M0QWL5_9RHOB|nr:aldehyde dehydrogenase family protein [Tabrizicola oligotrophica]NEY91787.1 aldehyde dehydrogenase family protein [Tabrizicola oligotrophica]
MQHLNHFYIDGQWVSPSADHDTMPVENPATGEVIGHLALGRAVDADRAVRAARGAFARGALPLADRIALLEAVIAEYDRRADDIAAAITLEMGAPPAFSREAQTWAGKVHLESTLAAAKTFTWEDRQGSTVLIREGIGVCALITPWNWPMNQIACKVAPALVSGCTMVLKPSELAPLSAVIFAEICHAVGVPNGVFNLIHGTGPEVGAALSAHPQVDMVSFTGSTRAGVAVALAAAPGVKRVAQELGGKSANIILPSADLDAAVSAGVAGCFGNAGQSCDAPTRMFVPRAQMPQALEIARVAAVAIQPAELGPVISHAQWQRIQSMIEKGVSEGATLVAGGPGLPDGVARGHYVRPTVFGDVTPDMTIAREEIFGPVLAILPYDTVDEAVSMANDSPYGLAAYVQGAADEALAVGKRLQAGQVHLNYPDWDTFAPFGGYKQSGNGREYGAYGIHDFCEVKALIGTA